MKVVKGFFVVIMMLSGASAFAQDSRTLEYMKQQEQRRKSALLRELDSAVYLMDNGNHLLADTKFREVLQNLKSVPSDLTFYFGKNSFHLQNHKQAIDWLNKYIQLKGTSGQYYGEATEILRQAEAKLISEREASARQADELLSSNYDIDCGPTGKVSCPVCKGDHVIIKKGPFGDEYRTCPYCNEHGVLTCEEYNMLLRGQLQKKK